MLTFLIKFRSFTTTKSSEEEKFLEISMLRESSTNCSHPVSNKLFSFEIVVVVVDVSVAAAAAVVVVIGAVNDVSEAIVDGDDVAVVAVVVIGAVDDVSDAVVDDDDVAVVVVVDKCDVVVWLS